MTTDEEPTPGSLELRELDVRPILDGGDDPFETILANLHSLAPGSVLHLVAPFRPRPLLARLEDQGHAYDDAQLAPESGKEVWSVAISIEGACPLADLRDLPPPEPMETILLALEEGHPYFARLPRYPRMLEAQLEDRGRTWLLLELKDGTALVWIAP